MTAQAPAITLSVAAMNCALNDSEVPEVLRSCSSRQNSNLR